MVRANGIIFIAAGLILLLNNFNLLPWEIWFVLWRFWPMIIVFWGLEVILGDNWIAELIVGIITLLVVAYILVQAIANNNSQFRNWMQNNFRWLPINEDLFKQPQSPRLRRFFFDSPSESL